MGAVLSPHSDQTGFMLELNHMQLHSLFLNVSKLANNAKNWTSDEMHNEVMIQWVDSNATKVIKHKLDN